MFRMAVADLDSPSYFVATAAAELGFFKEEGIDVELEPIFGGKNGPERLRDGTLHFFGGPAYATTRAFPGWKGAKLLCALSQYSYWFMGIRADLKVRRGDLDALKGLRISSSTEGPGLGLLYLLAQSGIDLERDKVQVVPVPSSGKNDQWRGRSGADAIEQGIADAFWGNGMRIAIAEKTRCRKTASRSAAWRRATRCALVQLRRPGDDRSIDRGAAGNRRRRGARHQEGPEGAAGRPFACHTDR
jgi:NitT/TauT family transport system substrate-binding protein